MLLTIIKNFYLRRKTAALFLFCSALAGTVITAALVTISLEISGKIARELRRFGANIVIEPKRDGLAALAGQTRYLSETDIPKAKTIFWRHNILGLAPMLYVPVTINHDNRVREIKMAGTWLLQSLPLPGESGTFPAGLKTVYNAWNIEGTWPKTDTEVALGCSLAESLNLTIGDSLTLLERSFRVTATVDAGSDEDDMGFMDLHSLQTVAHLENKVSRIMVNSLTTPMDDFAVRDPKTMTTLEYEKWYCTGYVTSIAKQLEETFAGSVASPVWPVAQTEGQVLGKLSLFIYLLTTIMLLAAALSVGATMLISLLRRTQEMALMKALGADHWQIMVIFMATALLLGLMGGAGGYLLSTGISGYLGQAVFGVAIADRSLLLPLSLGAARFHLCAGDATAAA